MEQKRPSWHETFMSMLDVLKNRSQCIKYKTAAMLINGNQIAAIGYNGTASHSIECCNYWENYYKINIDNKQDSQMTSQENKQDSKQSESDIQTTSQQNNQENKQDSKQSSTTYANWLLTDDFKTLHREWSKINEIHAESNALSYVSKHDNVKYKLYTLYSPCDSCAKEIVKYKNIIDIVIYKHVYPRGVDALRYLKKHEVNYMQIE